MRLQDPHKIPQPHRQIRAVYDEQTIRVYQAYSDDIADVALANGTFGSPPFKMSRMTWIKPSFLWMMYRAGWGLKDAGQKRILAIDVTREGFEWALSHSCSSHADQTETREYLEGKRDSSPVRIQWDPERDIYLRPLDYRSIQIGLSKEAIDLYATQWIRRITDVSALALAAYRLVQEQKLDEAVSMLPREKPYLLNASLADRVGSTPQ
jgi:hypothetical protein